VKKPKTTRGLNIIENHFYPEFSDKVVQKIPKIHNIKLHTFKVMASHEKDKIRGLKYIKDIIKYFWSKHPFNCSIILIMKAIINPSYKDTLAFNAWNLKVNKTDEVCIILVIILLKSVKLYWN